ncbi:hypothetical protein DNU06_04015 [Putridiphycobacter roseus]|uniref:PPM-type phosphatase domain-containing protein n=1 Tax=Putridiphycobacter roseus TaxID=2219161 RepID=A0A2W1NFB8_9FLAO|nr:SpoIIE family protein phosphatase [Putridiphycobacter roseus]PZE17793.1 hypothetical protein DNU06_04015 [Putridiphycobacter roseus]
MITEYKKFTEPASAELETARTIQEGLLPKPRHFQRLFNDSFVLDIPLNIISGDFYWIGAKNDLSYAVIGDCTGHGTAAALLSVLAINLFEYTIMNKGLKKTYKILQEVDKRFIESFKNIEEENFDNPWIDLSIVCIDKKKSKLYFSSANHKLIHISKQAEMQVIKGNKYPIGGWQMEQNRTFDPQIIDYQPGDIIFMGSDGFQDQFGGPKFKKYKLKRLNNLLQSNFNLPFNQLKTLLEFEFNAWKGDNFQVDDVCLMGIKL